MSKNTTTVLLVGAGAVVGAFLLIPQLRYWFAVNFLPAGTVKGATGSTLKVVPAVDFPGSKLPAKPDWINPDGSPGYLFR